MNTWWYIHTVTLYKHSCSWTRDDIYIPQLYINFPAVEHLMIYTYRNFISIFLEMNTGWYIHTATLYQFSCRWTPDDIYIPQLSINFPADEQVMICAYRNFIPTFLHKNTWWYLHTATLHQLSCRGTPYDIYIPQLYINFTADEQLMIYTYRNFIPTFLHTNTWWYVHTATLYTDWSVFSTSLQMNRCWYIDAATLCHFLFDEHVIIDIFAAALY